MAFIRCLRWRTVASVMLLTGLLTGCSSGFTNIAPAPPEHYQSLGPASGSACGTMLLLATAYNFIPAGLNSRVERAYQDAVASVPGATGLVDVTIQDDWYWWIIGTFRCTTISGVAIR